MSESSDLRKKVQSLRIPEERKNTRGSHLSWVLVLLLLGTNGYSGYRVYQFQQAALNQPDQKTTTKTMKMDAGSSDAPGSAPSTENGMTAAPPRGQIALESRGYIMPAKTILVSPKVSGMVVQLNIEEGKRVVQGDILAIIESTEYQSEFDRQSALLSASQQRLLELERGSRPEEVSQAEAQLSEAQTQVEEDERQYKRQLQLAKQNAGTETALTQAETQFLGQQRRVEQSQLGLELLRKGPRAERVEIARAEVLQVQADLDRAAWRLGNCTIRAPITGTILRKNAEEGNIVNPIAFNGSYSICEMADLADLEVDLKIMESNLRKIQVGQRCSITTEAWPGRIYDGQVDRLMPIADRAQGAIPARVKMRIPPEEEGIYLKPEMSAAVTFFNDATLIEKPLAGPSGP